MRCVVDHEGKWLCGPPDKISVTSIKPQKQPTREVTEPITTATPPVSQPSETKAVRAQQTTVPTVDTATTGMENAPAVQLVTEATEDQPLRWDLPAQFTCISGCPIPEEEGEEDGAGASEQILSLSLANRENAELSIDAADLEVRGKNVFIYQGDVVIERADQLILSDHATYDDGSKIFEAKGNVHYREVGTRLKGDEAVYNTDTESGTIYNAQYWLTQTGASGIASRIDLLSPYTRQYTDATYTLCNPKEKSWELYADKVNLDDIEGWGTAENATVVFQGVPVMYTPFYTFALDERRKSGVLSPTYGYESGSGAFISVPYYWNIAPNQDATITVKEMGKRGPDFSANYRYEFINDRGTLNASFLPRDQIYNESRHHVEFKHNGSHFDDRLPNPIEYRVNYATLSDKGYVNDFGNSIAVSASDTLTQTAQADYSEDQFKMSALVSDYYTVVDIEEASEPYRRLPQIDASWSSPGGDDKINYGISGQFTYFTHVADSKPNAQRYWVSPNASYNYTFLQDSAFIKPAVSVSQTYYELETGNTSSLTVPNYSIETGVFLEREVTDTFELMGGEEGYIQTLEPSVKFNLIPSGRDSGQNFDSPESSGTDGIDLSAFHGKDSAPRTKNMAWTINSDWVRAEDNFKLISLSATQSRNFNKDVTRRWSNLATTVSAKFDPHTAYLAHSWDPYDHHNDTVNASYQYSDMYGKLLNFNYIFSNGSGSETSDEEIDLSGAWKYNHNWSFYGRYKHDMAENNDRPIEDLYGFSYDTCCWSASFTFHNTFRGTAVNPDVTNDRIEKKWYLTLELKGIGRLAGRSKKLDKLLSSSIKGYDTYNSRPERDEFDDQ